ncbi:MAG: arsenic resistance protein [Candidatus Methanomethylophilaceae archaeon]|nr:arsenic resistance protein [Candidatus Methanomethylophilaceae archaeon]
MNAAFLHPLIMLASAIIGLITGNLLDCGWTTDLIQPFLMIMLFVVFMCVSIRDIGRSFTNKRFTIIAILINFVWTPIFAIILGLFFDNIDIRIGLLMLLITPCTDWYLVFTATAKGNVPLSSALLPLNLILQIVLMPVYLILFFNTQIDLDIPQLLWSMVFVLIIPIIASVVVKFISTKAETVKKIESKITDNGDNLQLFFLCLAIMVMFASQADELMNNLDLFVMLIIPLLIFFVVNYSISTTVSKIQKYDYKDTTSLVFTTMARNSPLSLAIAVAAFPDATLLLLVLVIAPLIELPVLSITAGYRLKKIETGA